MTETASYLDFIPVFETLNEAIVIFDREKYLWANEAYARLRGFESPDELIGTSIFTGIHPDETQENVRVIAERIRTRESTIGTWRMLKKDGSYQLVIAHSSLLPDQEKVITVAIIRPIDDVHGDIVPKFTEASLKHEISSALTVIVGYFELFRIHDAVTQYPELEKWFDVIDQNIKRIEEIINKIG